MKKKQTITCIIVDDELIAREIIETHLSKIPHIKLVGSFSTAMDAFNCLFKQHIDLIFLDINMPEISGISFAKSIHKTSKIIFTTAYRDYAVEGFELKALDYLLKPISFERLLQAVNSYGEANFQRNQNQKQPLAQADFIFVRSDRKMIKIAFEAIIYIESYSDYIKIHLEDKTVVTRMTITTIEAKLPHTKFLRIHRSFIVAIKNITAFTTEEILLEKLTLPISRTYKKEVLTYLEKF